MSRAAEPDENIGHNSLTASVPRGGVFLSRPWEWQLGFTYVVAVDRPAFDAWTPTRG